MKIAHRNVAALVALPAGRSEERLALPREEFASLLGARGERLTVMVLLMACDR